MKVFLSKLQVFKQHDSDNKNFLNWKIPNFYDEHFFFQVVIKLKLFLQTYTLR
jgi:hypothetical protein